MEEIIKSFKKEFNLIRSLGYVKAVNNNYSGIGLTFESLLGKEFDSFPIPDYKNVIEIKTKLAFSTKPIHLFKLTPDGEDFFETKRIYNKYGYYFNGMNKIFNGKVVSNKRVKIGYSYYFSLEVNYIEEKVKLLVFDKFSNLIDNSTYWDFKNIENAIYRKLQYLALIDVWPTQRNGIKYYKYFRYNIYKFSNIYTFLNLLDKGLISITFSIDSYKTQNRLGQIHDHGTSFDIDKNNINELFIIVD